MKSRRIKLIIALLVVVTLAACVQPRKRSYSHLLDEEDAITKSRPPDGVAFHLMFGMSDYDDLTFERQSTTTPGVTAETDISNMPIIGLAGQFPFVGEEVQAGMEAGFTFGAWGDDDRVAFSNNLVAVDLDSFLFLVDIFAGGYVATNIDRKVRLYAGAGPMLLFGYYEEETEDTDFRATELYIDDDEVALGVGLYARVGIDFFIDENSLVGFSARVVDTELGFGGDVGDVDVEGVQFLMTWGFAF